MKILTLPLTKERERERQRERERVAKASNFKSISKTPVNFSLVPKLLLSFVVRPRRKFEKRKLVLNLDLVIVTSKSNIFIASTKVLNVLQISAEN